MKKREEEGDEVMESKEKRGKGRWKESDEEEGQKGRG